MIDDEMTLWKRDCLELPLRTDCIRFAVMKRNGLIFNAWVVRIEQTGNAYIYCALT